MPRIPPTQLSKYGHSASEARTVKITPAVGEANRPRGPPEENDLLGAFTIPEFVVLFKVCRSVIYAEARAGRLKLAKIRSRTVITRSEARRYGELLDSEAAANDTPDAA